MRSDIEIAGVETGEHLGIDWTSDRRELAEAIPPAYTSFIGAQLLAVIEVAA
jgi:DNA (cytosine-5)-methyltransferase 1